MLKTKQYFLKAKSQWLNEMLAVAIFGGLGALARFAVSELLYLIPGNFPYAIVIVNVVGSFLIGACYALFQRFRFSKVSKAIQAGIMIGFLGGFTTFSSFSMNNVNLLERGHPVLFAINVSATLLLCFAGTALGMVTFPRNQA